MLQKCPDTKDEYNRHHRKLLEVCLNFLNVCFQMDLSPVKQLAWNKVHCFVNSLKWSAYPCVAHTATSLVLDPTEDFEMLLYKWLLGSLVKCGYDVDEKYTPGDTLLAIVLRGKLRR